MLVGLFGNDRVLASEAIRGQAYRCPACNASLILKQGRRRMHHFAHKPPICEWAKGETLQHLEAKDFFYKELTSRGLHVELERMLLFGSRTRRADLFVRSPQGREVVIELQHTLLPLEELEARAADYAALGLAQIWIPFLRSEFLSAAEIQPDGSLLIEKYVANPFVRWISGFHLGKGMWMYHAEAKNLWHAVLRPHELWIEHSEYFDETGEEHSSGGYYRESKRWKKLILRGPYEIKDLKISSMRRGARKLSRYSWPEGLVVNFVCPK